jgi:hypothetical protein
MKQIMIVLSLIVLSYSAASFSASVGELVEYKDGVLTLKIDTCGGTVAPVVKFKPLEEINDPSLYSGIYKATISLSSSENRMCPYSAPSTVYLSLLKEFKEWANSSEGTSSAKEILEKDGEIEIVSNVTTQISFKKSRSLNH